MATRYGTIGTTGQYTYFKNPVSTGITMEAGEYPVTITLSLSAGGARWYNMNSERLAIELYLVDAAGWGNYTLLQTWNINGTSAANTPNSWTLSAAAGKQFKGKTLMLQMYNTRPGSGWDTCDFTPLQHQATVTVTTAYDTFNITCNSSAGGSLSASASSAQGGSTITLYPSANTGYYLTGYTTSPSVTITNNQFTMPSSNITVTANFAKTSYTVSGAVSPSGGGSMTRSKSTANYGDTITLTQSAATGYHFTGWSSSPSVTITNNAFTMPASNVTITANFAKTSYTVSKASSPSNGGSMTLSKTSANYGDTITLTQSAATGYYFTGWSSSPSVTISNNSFTMPASNVTITANFAKVTYTVSKASSPAAGGSMTISRTTANYGDTVTLSATPATGYYFSNWSTSPSVTITNNAFTMPASNITVTAIFAKVSYSITKTTSPSGAGTVTTSKTTANYGDSITVSQTAAAGYYFNGWTSSPANLISSNAFTMPAANVTVTANYLKRSTATLSATTLTGNGSVTLNISADKTTYSHKYKLSFGTNMETSLTNVAAGTNKVTISIPDSWSNYIPSATTKTGGTLVLYTYNGSTQIGSYTISNLTYAVRNTAVPTIGTITTSISSSYNTWSLYIQNKCGVRIQTSASGVLSSTISSLRVYVNGYSGANYDKTVTTSSIDFTTGQLSMAGTNTITVKVTDSRGRTATKTTTISVNAYSSPSGSLNVRRVNSGGTDDDMGQYGKFTLTKNYTAVGSNSLTVKITSQGTQVTVTGTSGDLLPNNRQTFSIQQEYTITMTLQDAFETVTVTGKLRSAKFLIYVNSTGKKLGFMKAASKGGANDKTIEFDGDSTIYIGDMTLAQYIQSVVNNM